MKLRKRKKNECDYLKISKSIRRNNIKKVLPIVKLYLSQHEVLRVRSDNGLRRAIFSNHFELMHM